MLGVGDELTRAELARNLAEVSHKTWIKQKVRVPRMLSRN
jgi:hypothetical protein